MASFRKRTISGITRWDVTVTRIGAARATKTFSTRALAETWARERERDVQRGSFRSTDLAARTTVGELIERYVVEVLPTKRSISSVKSAASNLKRELGRIPLLALTGEHLAGYRDKRLRTEARGGGKAGRLLGHKISGDSVRKELGLLRRVIQTSIRDWGIHLPAGNPLALVKLPPPGRSRNRRLSVAEYPALLAGARTSKSRWLAPAIELAVETAMRRGELVALQWDHVDLTRRVARVLESKNGEPRDIPLSSRAVAVLQGLPVRPLRGGLVFRGLRASSLTQSFERLCRRLGLDDLRWHDLRHEATSRLVETFNGDVVSVSAITGHRTLQMLKRYTHPRAEDLARRLV